MRVAVVGLGYWGPNILRVLADMEDVEVSWLCDLDEERLERFGRRYPTSRRTTDLDEVLDDGDLDAAVVATPVFTHGELATRCLEADLHTFVEKPLASSSAECDRLLAIAHEQDLTLMCGQIFLYSPPVRAVGDLLAGGELGDAYFISSTRVNLGLHQSDVSVIWDLGPHDFSILLQWLGEMPEKIRAIGRDSVVPGIADVAFVTMSFPSGVIANVELSWLAPSKVRRTVIVGSEKMVIYEDGAPEPVRIFDHGVVYEDPETFGEYHLSYRTGDIRSPRIDVTEPLAAEMADFVGATRNGHPPFATAELARDVVRMTEAAQASLEQGGVELPAGGSEGPASARMSKQISGIGSEQLR